MTPPSSPSVELQPGSPAAQGGVFSPLVSAPVLEPGQASFEHGLPAALLSPGQGLHLGRFRLHGGITGSVAYDDNVRAGTSGRQDDVIWTVSPYASLSTEGPNARALRVSYRPSFLFYLDESDLDSVNHFGTVDLRWPLNRLSLGLSENVSAASVIVRDVGNRAMQRTFGTQASADYQLSHRTSLQGSVRHDLWDYDRPLIDSQQWTEQAWLDYRFGGRTSAGVGVALAQVDVEQGPSQTSEGPAIRVTYEPLPRLTLAASAGVEFRQFDSDVSNTTEPVFKFAGMYQVREGTTASIEAHRAEQASGLVAGANYLETGFSGGVSQTFLRRFVGTLGGGYSSADYHATEVGVRADRTDSYYFLRTSLGWTPADTWGLGLFYERRENDSSAGFSFDQNVVGFQASWSF